MARRQGSASSHKYQVEGGRPVPDWKAFMGVSENKANLTNYVSADLEENIQRRPAIFKTSNQKVFLAGGYASGLMTKCVTSTDVTKVCFCTQ